MSPVTVGLAWLLAVFVGVAFATAILAPGYPLYLRVAGVFGVALFGVGPVIALLSHHNALGHVETGVLLSGIVGTVLGVWLGCRMRQVQRAAAHRP